MANEKIKIEVGKTYMTFNHHLIKVISIQDNEEKLTHIKNISEDSGEWLALSRIEDKVVKLIR